MNIIRALISQLYGFAGTLAIAKSRSLNTIRSISFISRPRLWLCRLSASRKAEEQIGVANLDVARYAARKPVLHALYPALFIEPKALGQFGGAAIMFNEFCISHTPDITRGV